MLTEQSAFVRLDWECQHFGLSAAKIFNCQLDDAELARTLAIARESGVRLLVWSTLPTRKLPADLLHEFEGSLVDQKVTFGRSLSATAAERASTKSSGLQILPFDCKIVSEELLSLAVAAGAFSRFRIDTHFEPGTFEAMYRIWLERSVNGELADVVLAARLRNQEAANKEQLGGLITISLRDGTATIGLIAVAAAVRGGGIGTALMRAAHAWMRQRGAQESRVVTQLANEPACRLYQRSGYEQSQVQHIYHFWL